jgi:hypothetical protein
MKLLAAVALSCSVVLAGCTARQRDEGVIRRQFVIPQTARTLVVEATPAESGWFGREGLKITMIFRLSASDFNAWSGVALSSGRWQPLPIPETVLKHLAGVRSAREARLRLAQETGKPLPPEGSVYNPSDAQLMKRFSASIPALPRSGWYQIRTAGTDIMRAPKTIRATLDHDVNDFMLAVLDPKEHTVMVRVSTKY